MKSGDFFPPFLVQQALTQIPVPAEHKLIHKLPKQQDQKKELFIKSPNKQKGKKTKGMTTIQEYFLSLNVTKAFVGVIPQGTAQEYPPEWQGSHCLSINQYIQ